MNPYKVLQGTLKTLTVAAPLALFAGAEGCIWGFGAVANKDAQKKFDAFTQTEIFQAVKAEKEANLTAMKNELDIAQQQQSKGELSTQAYLDMKYEYDQRVKSFNSEDFVLSTMKKYGNGVYDDYKSSSDASSGCMTLGALYSILGIPVTIMVEIKPVYVDWFWNIELAFGDKIDAYDKERRKTCATNGNCATNGKTEKPLER